jgi:hypothetical protein
MSRVTRLLKRTNDSPRHVLKTYYINLNHSKDLVVSKAKLRQAGSINMTPTAVFIQPNCRAHVECQQQYLVT